MHIGKRLWRHIVTTRHAARKLFPASALQVIQSAIATGEVTHRAEVRVVIEAALPIAFVLRGGSARHRAVELFSHYRIWDTEENCGLLLYINLADHKVEIVADRGVDRAVGKKDWQDICGMITAGFAAGEYHESIPIALAQLNLLLTRHYPQLGPQHNQLSDKPLML
ncbi:TPM domain-containing protein [Oxalobacteraceae bacterium CAVE-383]|nr:TPM domain-containing protein [Oxalobacteraceae bacterium CAVE-383]